MHCLIRRLVRNAHEQTRILADCLRHTDGKKIDYAGLAKIGIFKSKYPNLMVRTYSIGSTIYFVYARITQVDRFSFTWGNPENIILP